MHFIAAGIGAKKSETGRNLTGSPGPFARSADGRSHEPDILAGTIGVGILAGLLQRTVRTRLFIPAQENATSLH